MLVTGPEPQDVYHFLWRVVVVGIVASVLCMVIGFALLIFQPYVPREASVPVLQTLSDALELRPVAWLELGILVLLATPMVSVVTAVAIYARARQGLFALMGVVVLCVVVRQWFPALVGFIVFGAIIRQWIFVVGGVLGLILLSLAAWL